MKLNALIVIGFVLIVVNIIITFFTQNVHSLIGWTLCLMTYIMGVDFEQRLEAKERGTN